MPPKDVNTKTKRRARKRNRRVASDSSSSSSSGSDSSSDEEAPLVPALLAARAAKGKERAFGAEGSVPLAAVVAQVQADEDDSSSDESSSSSSSSSSASSSSSSSSASSASSTQKPNTTQPKLALNPNSSSTTNTTTPALSRPKPSRTSRSPSPPPARIPSFFNTSTRPSFLPAPPAASEVNSASNSTKDLAKEDTEEELKRKKFREFWMGKMVVGFGQDLDTVRQEPSLTSSRLNLLINSLTSGIDVFSTGASTNTNGRSDGPDGGDEKMEVDERDVVLGKI
ncbi:Ribosome-assembly protein 3 [Phaffia rhodozyma]|uniref:Ribosome assembly protein 3 n=1 Tax=Phaffia rhodozyma TaxID=264483 RepID=A0A0F7SN97_PHARH|nr:Ribosome-assembly protein 3 [Phaffia rhodozyma]